MPTQRCRRWTLVLALGGLAVLAACGGKGKAATSGGSPNLTCNVQERLATPELVTALTRAGWEVQIVSNDEQPQQNRLLAQRVVAAATAGNPGTQSGGTNQAGGDTTNNFFCGKDSGPVAFPGGTNNVNSGNTTTENPPLAERRR